MKKFLAYFGTTIVVSLLAFSPLTAFAVADTQNPGDITSLTATAGDASVNLKWSAATDNVGVTGYRVYYGTTPVTKTGDAYDLDKDVMNVLEYNLTGLTNGTKYYFSVVAYDAAGLESLHWAPEASATPACTTPDGGGTGADTVAPKVASASALDKEDVKVVFTEAIVLPSTSPQDSFSIERDDNFEPLTVLDAKMDSTDTTNKTVILVTDAQEKDVSYTLTAGIDIKDTAGNFIKSGTSDTASFKGSAAAKQGTEGQDTPLEMVSAESDDFTHIIVNFSKTIVLTTDPSEDFEITEKDDSSKKLEVLSVELGNTDEGVENGAALITTSTQEDMVYVVTSNGLMDEFGNEVDSQKNEQEFQGAVQESDLVAPNDVTKFVGKTIFDAGKSFIKLTWKLPTSDETNAPSSQNLDIAPDMGLGEGGSTYPEDVTPANQESLDQDVTSYTYDNGGDGLTPGEYWFKLTEKNSAGESKGKTVKVVIAETGPEMLGLLLVSVGLGRIFGKKKNKK